eukprot:10939901-Prorocentrum_lima.AAC.1
MRRDLHGRTCRHSVMLDETHRRPRRAFQPERRSLAVKHLLSRRNVMLGQLPVLVAPASAEAQSLDNLATVLLRPPGVLRDLVA